MFKISTGHRALTLLLRMIQPKGSISWYISELQWFRSQTIRRAAAKLNGQKVFSHALRPTDQGDDPRGSVNHLKLLNKTVKLELRL